MGMCLGHTSKKGMSSSCSCTMHAVLGNRLLPYSSGKSSHSMQWLSGHLRPCSARTPHLTPRSRRHSHHQAEGLTGACCVSCRAQGDHVNNKATVVAQACCYNPNPEPDYPEDDDDKYDDKYEKHDDKHEKHDDKYEKHGDKYEKHGDKYEKHDDKYEDAPAPEPYKKHSKTHHKKPAEEDDEPPTQGSYGKYGHKSRAGADDAAAAIAASAGAATQASAAQPATQQPQVAPHLG